MKKGFKFIVPRSEEHRKNQGKAISEAFTEERKKEYSTRMKLVWALAKNRK